jgi:ADP-ribose pyrophosphatase
LKKPAFLGEVELFRGLRFSVVRRKYSKDGGVFERDVVVFPEAVVVLPFISRDRVILVRQFRAPFNDFIIEAPAGVVDEGESPEDTARRELVEETGYYPRRLTKIGSFTPAPGYSTEVLHFYVAEDLEYVGSRPEVYEVLEPLDFSFKEVYEMVLRNEIRDAKTALIVLLYAALRGVEL